MTHTVFRDRHDQQVPHSAVGYFRARDGSLHPEPNVFHAVGDGGLWTSADDLIRWSENFFHDRLTDGRPAAVLTTRGRLNNGSTIDHAWGMSIRTYRGLRMISHGGSFPGWMAKLVWFPDVHLAIAWLSNCSTTDVNSLLFRAADVYLDPLVGQI